MKQKVIKIGSSAGVTISRSNLDELGVTVGDTVETRVEDGVLSIQPASPSKKTAIDPQILQWGDEFIAKNSELLKRLKDK